MYIPESKENILGDIYLYMYIYIRKIFQLYIRSDVFIIIQLYGTFRNIVTEDETS